ncbi:chaperonin CPN60-2, mitochondrial [Trifolium repens]|nr:chaperonin CPN60-2, mitochondrial [Trifolium repens]
MASITGTSMSLLSNQSMVCAIKAHGFGENRKSGLQDLDVLTGVWAISGHVVLKRKKDFDEASEANAWRLLAEVSLSEERFQVNAPIFEAIALTEELDDNLQCLPNDDAVDSSTYHAVVAGSQECVVLQ